MCMPQTFDVAFLILLSLKSSKYVTPAEFNITFFRLKQFNNVAPNISKEGVKYRINFTYVSSENIYVLINKIRQNFEIDIWKSHFVW